MLPESPERAYPAVDGNRCRDLHLIYKEFRRAGNRIEQVGGVKDTTRSPTESTNLESLVSETKPPTQEWARVIFLGCVLKS